MFSSSLISRLMQASSVSPASNFLLGNSHFKGILMAAPRCTTSVLEPNKIIAQVTFMGNMGRGFGGVMSPKPSMLPDITSFGVLNKEPGRRYLAVYSGWRHILLPTKLFIMGIKHLLFRQIGNFCDIELIGKPDRNTSFSRCV